MIDAYVLRSIHRRCNYDRDMVMQAMSVLLDEWDRRNQGSSTQESPADNKVGYYVKQYERSGMADVVILPYLKEENDTQYLSTDHINKLLEIIEGMLEYQPFEVLSVHDEFKCHANNMNHLRQQYINIFAEIAESDLLSDILSQIHGVFGICPKLSNNLGELIRGSNYALS